MTLLKIYLAISFIIMALVFLRFLYEDLDRRFNKKTKRVKASWLYCYSDKECWYIVLACAPFVNLVTLAFIVRLIWRSFPSDKSVIGGP